MTSDNTGIIAEIDYIRQRDGQVAKDFGGARRITLVDGRVLTFSEGDMAHRGLNFALEAQRRLIGRRISWVWFGRHRIPANMELAEEK